MLPTHTCVCTPNPHRMRECQLTRDRCGTLDFDSISQGFSWKFYGRMQEDRNWLTGCLRFVHEGVIDYREFGIDWKLDSAACLIEF